MAVRTETVGERLKQAMECHPRAPESQYGRLTWLKLELEKVGVQVALETVRKWSANQTIPRPKRMSALAKVLGVDEAWLALGRTSSPSDVHGAEVRRATAAALCVGGLIELTGGRVAFESGDARAGAGSAELSAIIDGHQLSIRAIAGMLAGDMATFPSAAVPAQTTLLGVIVVDGSPVVLDLTDAGRRSTDTNGAIEGLLTDKGLKVGDQLFGRVMAFAQLSGKAPGVRTDGTLD